MCWRRQHTGQSAPGPDSVRRVKLVLFGPGHRKRRLCKFRCRVRPHDVSSRLAQPVLSEGLWLVRHARPLVDAGVCYGATDMPADSYESAFNRITWQGGESFAGRGWQTRGALAGQAARTCVLRLTLAQMRWWRAYAAASTPPLEYRCPGKREWSLRPHLRTTCPGVGFWRANRQPEVAAVGLRAQAPFAVATKR